jgi:hypothetical protein
MGKVTNGEKWRITEEMNMKKVCAKIVLKISADSKKLE